MSACQICTWPLRVVCLRTYPRIRVEPNRCGPVSRFSISRFITAQWSPDSSAFFLNDEFASDRTDAYLYDVQTLDRLNVGKKIIAAYPNAKKFSRDHAYFEGERWQDAKHVTVRFRGHTGSPVVCFDSRYIVTRDGSVKKLFETAGPIDRVLCY
jgi:hypothetical protein